MIDFLYRFISNRCEFVSNRVPRLSLWGSTALEDGNDLGTGVNDSRLSVEKGGVRRVSRRDAQSCWPPVWITREGLKDVRGRSENAKTRLRGEAIAHLSGVIDPRLHHAARLGLKPVLYEAGEVWSQMLRWHPKTSFRMLHYALRAARASPQLRVGERRRCDGLIVVQRVAASLFAAIHD